MRSSKQRDAVYQVLCSSCDHPTADKIFERVQRIIPNISLGTVYRNLGQLKDEGLINTLETSDKKVHYDGNVSEHIHFLCTRCYNITDIYCKRAVPAEVKEMGLQVQGEKTVYYGICKNCCGK